MTQEPCVMCSMALTHSRVKKVLYTIRNLEDGGLGSRFNVHLESLLNHNYSVYSNLRIQYDAMEDDATSY